MVVERWMGMAAFLGSASMPMACSSPSHSTAVSDGGTTSSAGSGGDFILFGNGGSNAGTSNGGSNGSGTGGLAAGGTLGVTCPDLHAPPANCPTKVYPGDATISLMMTTQADVDALAGYTELQASLEMRVTSGADAVVNLDALRCLQTIQYDLRVNGAPSLTSLDGLRELTEVGGFVEIDNEPLMKLGCGLRKLAKLGANGGPPYVEFDHDPLIDRIELPLLAKPGHFRVDSDETLEAIVASPALDTLGQFFVTYNPALTSLSGFAGLKSVNELRITNNPMLPICQARAIVDGLSAPPPVANDTSSNLGASCP